jgi:TonB family protein
MMRSIALLLWTAAQTTTTNSAVISGRLLSTEDAPVTGVRVVALETAYPRLNIAGQSETDKDGRYRLENLSPGEYFIVADPFRIPSYYPGTGNRDNSATVSVTPGAVLNGVDFRFVRSSGILRAVRTGARGQTRLSGILLDTQGRGLPDFTVMLSSSAANAKLWAVTDASGSFEFPSLTAGEFFLEALAPVQELHEDLRMPITLHTDEILEQEIGIRGLGNFQQRPDLYGPANPRERSESLRRNGPGAPTFWRCQDPNSQGQPEYSEALRAANVKGSVAVQVNIDPDGKLVRLRIASSDTNPDLARIAVQALSQWRFNPLKWRRDSSNRNTVSCNGEGEVEEFQGTVTFDFPPR